MRKDGFAPDLVCASSSAGGSLYVRDIFPEAFYLVQADWFYNQGESHCFFNRGRPRPPADFAPARVRNLWEYNALGDADLAVISSEWQRGQYPEFLAQRLRVLHSGVDTAFFSPAPVAGFAGGGLDLADADELISFSGPLHDTARGFAQFVRCLPRLLELRPACHVLVAWPAPESHGGRSGEEARRREAEALCRCREDLPLPPEARARVHLLGPCPLNEYRRMLRASTVHVYLTAPYALSTGILEAMACGGLVVGSDTAPVREVLRHGVNGFLCDFWDARAMAETVAGVAARAPRLAFIGQEARSAVRRDYDAAAQVERLRSVVLESMAARNGTA
ncbi:glycosyltransferase [uncultured Desulfovibrio sp.]|uniref:glycosyltransferase n=1 Tax=uncultured Desulfovibrio sp. TaxID=167968 RepID=UPI0026DB967C|nr:glycosyltransferase [uncultured Desulfovibrio sp.]